MADEKRERTPIPCTEVVVYFTIGRQGKHETAVFHSDTASEEVKELFRCAAEASPRDILKLWDSSDRLLNISPKLQPNSPATRYTLEVVAAHCNGMLLDELGVDLRSLEERVAQIEKRFRGDVDELPPTVQELKQEVDKFRNKLETTEHLSWLGFHNDFPEPTTTMASRRLQYRRKSSTEKIRVRDKFFSICDLAVSDEVRHGIRRPSFDSCQWEDEEVLVLLQQMFVDLELPARFNIELPVLRNFLVEVYDHYNEVPFHNFRHCFCVAQMMYAMIWCIDLPSKIGYQETLILLTACICHDLDHPGYNNIYQINAGTELALRYNDISPLENHHCSVAFRLLSKTGCNFLSALSYAEFRVVREGIIRCILATDMARHNEILEQFRNVTREFDYRNKAHINLLEMVLIKVADISNEARPMDVAEPWLDRLLQEFFKQSDAEKLEGLPVTPFMDRDKITKPSSQVGFIGLVLLPLFEALGELFTDLQELIVIPVRDALEYYRRLNDAERLHRKSIVESSISADAAAHLVKSSSVQSRRSFLTDGDDEGDSTSNMTDGDEEDTVTEVEHSEKALTFKISTDGARKSYPGSRKGSRDKPDVEFSKLMHSKLASPGALSSEEDESLQRELEDFKVSKKVLEDSIWEVNADGKRVSGKGSQKAVSDLARLKDEAKVITNIHKSIGNLQQTKGSGGDGSKFADGEDVKGKITQEPIRQRAVDLGANCSSDKDGRVDGLNADLGVVNVPNVKGALVSAHGPKGIAKEGTTVVLGSESPVSENGQPIDLQMESDFNVDLSEPLLSPTCTLDVDKKDKKSEPLKSLSLIYRFKHFTDRLSFNQGVDKESSGSTSEYSTPKRKQNDLQTGNRATTLPHSRRRKGWRSFIGGGGGGGGNKGQLTTTSLECVEKQSPSGDKKRHVNSSKNSLETADLMFTEHGASSSRLAGSLDSVLNQEAKENNNRKKTGSPGFLRRGNWMTSLACSFRSRRNQQLPECTDEWNK